MATPGKKAKAPAKPSRRTTKPHPHTHERPHDHEHEKPVFRIQADGTIERVKDARD